MVSIILKQFKWDISATVLILGAVGAICIYIIMIMFSGAAEELREKKAAERNVAG